MKLRLAIDVDYKPNGLTKKELKGYLYDAAQYLANNGLLSGESDAEVKTWNSTVFDMKLAGAKGDKEFLALKKVIREALEGNSNDAEHDALLEVAQFFDIAFKTEND